MAINKVEICGVDTGKLPRISYKKSTELLERIKSGDESARDEFIQANLRLVLSVIQRFSNRGEQPDDLFEVFRPFEHGASTIFLCHVEQSTVFAFLLCPLLGRFPLCIYFIE